MKKINKVLAGLTLLLSVIPLTTGLRAEEFGVHKEGKSLILVSEGERFEVNYKDSYGWLKMEELEGAIATLVKFPPYKTSNWFAGRYLKEAKLLLDKDDEKVIYLKGYAHSQKKVEGKWTRPKAEEVYLEMNLRIKKGFPCLFIRQRLISTAENPLKVSFSNYVTRAKSSQFRRYSIPGEKVETPSKKWLVSKSKDWILVSPGNALYIKKFLEEGAILEAPRIILFKAKTPEEVKELYEKVKEMELSPFLSPEKGLAKDIPVLSKKVSSVKLDNQPNKLVIDLIKLAPYADWINYDGKIRFGHTQEKRGCVFSEKNPAGHQSLFTTYMHKDGYLRGKYSLLFPNAEKLLFNAKFKAGRAWLGYYKKGKRSKYILEKASRFPATGFDVSSLSGQEANILLKGQGGSGLDFHWDKAEIILFYPDKGKPDLGLSASDISLLPQPDGKVIIAAKIHNIGKKKAASFKTTLYDGETLLLKKNIPSLSPEDSFLLQSSPIELKQGTHKIRVKIETIQEENSKDNNEAVLFCKAPLWGIMIKNIEAKPYPWRTEHLKVNLDNRLSDLKEYKLRCSIYDYFGKEIKEITKRIPRGKDSLLLRPFPGKKIGWWKAEVSLLYKDTRIDKLSAAFCYAPEPKSLSGSIFGVCYYPTGSRLPPLNSVKYTGATNVAMGWFSLVKNPERPDSQLAAEKIATKKMDTLLAQDQVPYVIIAKYGWPPIPKEDDKFVEFLSQLKERAYDAASKYKGKHTWWAVLNERNSTIPPAKYTRILKAVYEGAKKGAPDCKVATVGLIGGAHSSLLDSGERGTEYDWTKEMYSQARGYFDAISSHGYSHLIPEEPRYEKETKPFIELIEKYADTGKIEYHDNEWSPAASSGSGSMAAHIVRVYLYELGKRERGANQLHYFCMRDYYRPTGWVRSGLLKYNLHPRPEYQAYAVMTHNLTGATFIEKKDIGEKRYFYIFERKGKKLAVIWKQKGEKEVLVLPAGRTIRITNLMGGEKKIKPEKNKVKVIISTDPVYVEGINLDDFKLISAYSYSKEANFEDDFPEARKLKEKGRIIFYNVAKSRWETGGRGINELIKEGLRRISPSPLPSSETIVSTYTKNSILLDGELSEWKANKWYEVSPSKGKLLRYKKTPVTKNELSYSFSSKWDKNNLYFAFKVKDGVIISKHKGAGLKAFGGDCIEFFLDSLNLKNSGKPGSEFSQYFFGLNRKIDRLEGSGKEIKSQMRWRRTKDGYNIEIAIPLEEIFLKGIKEGYRIGFDVGVDDCTDARFWPETQLVWHGVFSGNHNCAGAGDLLFVK